MCVDFEFHIIFSIFDFHSIQSWYPRFQISAWLSALFRRDVSFPLTLSRLPFLPQRRRPLKVQ